MNVVHLTASPFFGGPERQLLGLAKALPPAFQTSVLSFSESGKCRPFLEQTANAGFESVELKHNFPAIPRAVCEIAGHLRRLHADVLCCSGYKPDLIGLLAARQTGTPVVSISHGWTAVTLKVRMNERLDRLVLPWMDAVVCVSEGQAVKVRRCGVEEKRLEVICNAVSLEKFTASSHDFRAKLEALFPERPRLIVGAGGRLSSEKGFGVLVDAAKTVVDRNAKIGFVVFGEGPERKELERRIAKANLTGRFVLAGFCDNLEAYLPHFDLIALSSFTEGMPVILLEAMAARRAVVATAVGGVPEVVDDGRTGLVTPSGDAVSLGAKISELLDDPDRCRRMGNEGRKRVEQLFTFESQSQRYAELFHRLVGSKKASRSNLVAV